MAELIIKNMPTYVMAWKELPGRGIFDTRPMHTTGDAPLVCRVIASYLYDWGKDKGGVTPCYMVVTPHGRHVEIAMNKVRVIGGEELGKLEREGLEIPRY